MLFGVISQLSIPSGLLCYQLLAVYGVVSTFILGLVMLGEPRQDRGIHWGALLSAIFELLKFMAQRNRNTNLCEETRGLQKGFAEATG
jgi:hypothetical protein